MVVCFVSSQCLGTKLAIVHWLAALESAGGTSVFTSEFWVSEVTIFPKSENVRDEWQLQRNQPLGTGLPQAKETETQQV